MCLALHAEIEKIDGDIATVMLDGVQMPVSLAFLPEAQVGDFVIVHVGYAMSRIDRAEAESQLELMQSFMDQGEGASVIAPMAEGGLS